MKMWHKAVCSLVNKIALPSNTDGCENVVSGTHNLPDAGLGELIKHASCSWLQLVLEDDESDEVET